jgi:4-methyl-5(b-hydroxyethyl)-thiazole monophosphate biosynthesis
MEHNVLVLLAQGCEELEAVSVIDLLRRGGVRVVVAGLDKNPVKASRGVVLVPDCSLDEALEQEGVLDMVVLPGGLPGSDHLANDARVPALLQRLNKAGKFTCAICAAPAVLAKAGLLADRKGTGYPGVLDKFDIPGFMYTGEAVVRDGTVITSRGPGTAMDFGLALVEALEGVEVRQQVEKALVRD